MPTSIDIHEDDTTSNPGRRGFLAAAASIAGMTAMIAAGALTSGCAQIRTHQGYLGEQILIESIQPGVDNRASVQATLGRPTFTSQFTTSTETPTWYYVARESRQLAFNRPRPVTQTILRPHLRQATDPD